IQQRPCDEKNLSIGSSRLDSLASTRNSRATTTDETDWAGEACFRGAAARKWRRVLRDGACRTRDFDGSVAAAAGKTPVGHNRSECRHRRSLQTETGSVDS